MNQQQPPYSPNVVNQTVDYGGITWKGQPGGGWTAQTATGGGPVPGASGGNASDILGIAGSLQQMQVAANQPAIATLGSQQGSLTGAYNDLLASIKGQQGTAVNAQTQVTNNEMAQRGILPTSTLYNQNMQNSLLPVNTSYASLYGQTGLSEQSDLMNLASQIASLQAGNVGNAITGATGIGNIETSLASLANQMYLGTSTTTPANVLATAQANYLGGNTQSGISSLLSQFGL